MRMQAADGWETRFRIGVELRAGRVIASNERCDLRGAPGRDTPRITSAFRAKEKRGVFACVP